MANRTTKTATRRTTIPRRAAGSFKELSARLDTARARVKSARRR